MNKKLLASVRFGGQFFYVRLIYFCVECCIKMKQQTSTCLMNVEVYSFFDCRKIFESVVFGLWGRNLVFVVWYWIAFNVGVINTFKDFYLVNNLVEIVPFLRNWSSISPQFFTMNFWKYLDIFLQFGGLFYGE